MANLGQKQGIFHIRIRFRGTEYKKSLKTRNQQCAETAQRLVELTIHRLTIGLQVVPEGVDAGDFILSGGTLRQPVAPVVPPPRISTHELIRHYLKSQENLLAPSYHYTQAVHLRHLSRFLGNRADDACDRVTFNDLDRFMQERLAKRRANTAERERITLRQFYRWAATLGHVESSRV